MGRKKLKEDEKKKRIVLYVKRKYHKKVKELINQTITDNERIRDTKKN